MTIVVKQTIMTVQFIQGKEYEMNGSKNKVAQILKTYALINAIAGAIAGLFLMADYAFIIGFAAFVGCLVVSFLIYAFGEVVELLNQIKENTASSKAPVAEADELPEL